MEKWNFLNILLVLTIFFSACDKKNDHKEEPFIRLVSRMDFANNEFYEFDYDAKNRISKIKIFWHSNNYTITYSYPTANTIVVSNIDESETTYTLNKDGYLTSYLNENITYANGCLQKSEEVSKDYIATNTWIWKNGNIETKSTEMKYFNNDKSGQNWSSTYICEYGTTLNKPVSIEFVHGFIITNLGIIPYGWFGKSTLNMPEKFVYSKENITHPHKSYRYETDKDGYVTKIYRTNYHGSEEDVEDEELIAAIQYK